MRWILPLILALLLAGCLGFGEQKKEMQATGAGEEIAISVAFPSDTAPIYFRGNSLIYADGYAQHWSDRSVYYFVLKLKNASINLPCSTARLNAKLNTGAIHKVSCYPVISEVNETRVIEEVPPMPDENGTETAAYNITRDFTVYQGTSSVARLNTANATDYILEIETDQFGLSDLKITAGGVSLG